MSCGHTNPEHAKFCLECGAARVFLIEERARLAMALGDARAGARLLQEARHAFEAMGATGHAERVRREVRA